MIIVNSHNKIHENDMKAFTCRHNVANLQLCLLCDENAGQFVAIKLTNQLTSSFYRIQRATFSPIFQAHHFCAFSNF